MSDINKEQIQHIQSFSRVSPTDGNPDWVKLYFEGSKEHGDYRAIRKGDEKSIMLHDNNRLDLQVTAMSFKECGPNGRPVCRIYFMALVEGDEKVTDMTIEEIEKALGKRIRLVGRK